MIFYIIGIIIWGVIWGCATNAVVKNKGYEENWFWWGFFFEFIALIVALTKPENKVNIEVRSHLSSFADESSNERLLKNDGWKCICGRVNPNYTGTCGCGRTKDFMEEYQNKKKLEDNGNQKLEEDNLKFENLKKLKELLDIGAISQEEYEEKRKQYI